MISPDLRGHGSAAALAPVTLAAVLGDLDALITEATTLIGYSQGGRIALHAALDPRLGPRISRLVLIGASPGIADPAERATRRAADAALADRIESLTIDAFAREWAQTPVLRGLDPETAAEAHADRLANTPAGLAAALRGLGTGTLTPLWDRLGELTIPVHLVCGERDEKFRAIAAEMATRLPDGEVLTVPGAGHQVHLEAPESIARLLP